MSVEIEHFESNEISDQKKVSESCPRGTYLHVLQYLHLGLMNTDQAVELYTIQEYDSNKESALFYNH